MSSEIELRTLDGDELSLDPAALAAIPEGSRLRPGDPGYEDATLIWNGLIDKQPALVIQPADASEVVAAVNLAREHRLLLSIKGGGHNIAGLSLADRGVTLDMSRMRAVDVDRDRMQVRVGPGCILREVDRVTQEKGLATMLGFVSETGVAGLTLGGGFGYMSRRFGYTVDNLVEVELVTADGQLRRVSHDSEPDLFWALRGGGGNFGVVTEFTYVLHEVGPQITGGLIAWPAEDHGEDVLGLYREMTASAPRELTLVTTMRLAPPAPFIPEQWHGKPMVALIACHTGDPDRAARDLAPIKGFGKPIADQIVLKTYVEQQSMLDPTQPKGAHYYWKTEFIPRLDDDYLETVRATAGEIESPMSQVFAFHLEGAVNEHAEDDGAVGNRDAAFVTGAAGAWPSDDPRGEDHHAWARATWERIRPFSTGGNYVNFQTMDDDVGRIEDSYRGNYERLRRIKADYDPENLFRVNRNLTPV
ncbi:MAG TPA: FAD-binding oxidoreductase [Acidimicrobiia bacterium]|nr:FAD-binding oxidoreductase [Acidimicrobiia bacterium]